VDSDRLRTSGIEFCHTIVTFRGALNPEFSSPGNSRSRVNGAAHAAAVTANAAWRISRSARIQAQTPGQAGLRVVRANSSARRATRNCKSNSSVSQGAAAGVVAGSIKVKVGMEGEKVTVAPDRTANKPNGALALQLRNRRV
jgi:hypothetical protein